MMNLPLRKSFKIQGLVQGVGFRPFIYRLALEYSLVGFIKNGMDGVEFEIEGLAKNIASFEEQLYPQLPPLARIDSLQTSYKQLLYEKSFEIKESANNLKISKTALISPDIATCHECLEDIKKDGKYQNYFATNCTNCGPRYSIIKTVPYDRKNSSMQKFVMCKSCHDEFINPNNRRYHAQPISCKNCGPQLKLIAKGVELKIDDNAKFQKVAELLKAGELIAIKGIGGFHIVCDTTHDEAIVKLRTHKNRATKPFAIMCKNLQQIKSYSHVNKKEEQLLTSKEAPIVILKKKESKISQFIAPNIDRIGCFLPYTPLHHLLFEHLQNPIVATSANLGHEPVITKVENIFKKLPFIEYILDFDREIINGVDDSLVQVVHGKTQVLRLARGYAPKVLKLPTKSDKKILAIGANAKNSIAFVVQESIILSPHIGDLNSLEAFEFFEQTLESFQRFYNFEPDVIIHDKHPTYMTTQWAKKQNKPLIAVGHHLAHIYACKAEFGLYGDYLGFSFDGTGYGEDGTLWGGEIFVGNTRKYHFKPIKLLGGEKAIQEPRRVGLSLLFDALSLENVLKLDLQTIKSFSHEQIQILHQSYLKNLNTPLSSSVGRIFDAVTSLSGVIQKTSYEGESGLLCESHYDTNIQESLNYTLKDGIIDIKIVAYILNNQNDKKKLNTLFINTLAKIILDIAKLEKMEVILSGGVFQNKTLVELTSKQLEAQNIKYYHQQESAINDGGIALGQIRSAQEIS